jgi:hypothetical protein
MRVRFKHPRIIDGKHYHGVVKDLDESLKSHWFFQGLVENEDIEILSDEPVVFEKKFDPKKPEFKPEVKLDVKPELDKKNVKKD